MGALKIISTTNEFEGHPIKEYHGLVRAEVVIGVNVVRDFLASVRDIFGGRARGLEHAIKAGSEELLRDLEHEAQRIGANAIVGLRINHSTAGANGGMVLISAYGTAVRVD